MFVRHTHAHTHAACAQLDRELRKLAADEKEESDQLGAWQRTHELYTSVRAPRAPGGAGSAHARVCTPVVKGDPMCKATVTHAHGVDMGARSCGMTCCERVTWTQTRALALGSRCE